MTTTQQAPQTDHQVRTAVLAELDWTPGIHADHVAAAVEDGAVTLSGRVETFVQKRAAVRAALRVRGVTAVADEIVIHHTWARPDDTDIAREVGDLLVRTPMAPTGSVTAEVHDGAVTLTGSVAWHYEREAIVRAVESLAGVEDVVDVISLRPEVHVSPERAVTKIADALRRNAGVDAEHVDVQVTGDTIALSGHVATWAERVQVDHAAWSTPGVTHVENDLYVTR